MIPSPVLLALLLGAGLVALVPALRLRDAGWPPSLVAVYWLALVALAVLVVETGIGARVVLPVLLVAFVAPIVVLRIRKRSRGTIVRDTVGRR